MTTTRRTLTALGATAAALATAGVLATAGGGPAAAAAAPEVFSGFRNSTLLSGSTPMVLSLGVPAGSYAVVSKVSAFNGLGGSQPAHNAFCELRAGGDFDKSFSRIRPGDEQTLTTTVVHTFTAPGVVQLTCNDTSGANLSTLLEFAKVTAVRVNALSNVPL